MSVTIEQFADRWTAWRHTNFNELWEPKEATCKAVDQRRDMAKEATKVETIDIDWGAVEGGNSEFQVQYPRMQWQHGEAKASGFMKTGGLFINKDEFPNFIGEGFAPATLITDEGKELEGYAASSAKLAVIRVKHEWHNDDNGRPKPFVQALCYVKGCDEIINLSLRSPSKALEFQKAFNQHIKQNVSVANSTRPAGTNALEPFALWFPVKASDPVKVTSKDGKASSTVTPPTIETPETIDRTYVVSLWVGSDNYKTFAATWRDTDAWQKAPIWEKRDEHTSDTPEYTGGDADPITQEQADQILHLGNLKQVNIAQYMLEYTNGGSNDIGNLTRGEAKQFIAELAKR